MPLRPDGRAVDTRPYLLFVNRPGPETRRAAARHLRERGIKVLSIDGDAAMVALLAARDVEPLSASPLFLGVHGGAFGEETSAQLAPEHRSAAALWTYRHSPDYRRLREDQTDEGKSWGDPGKLPPGPAAAMDPERFKDLLLAQLKTDERKVRRKFKGKQRRRLTGAAFAKLEKDLSKRVGTAVAHFVANIVYYLDPMYTPVVEGTPGQVLKGLCASSACRKMEGEVSVGVVFVQSTRAGLTFSSSEHNQLRAEIADGLEWLAEAAPAAARLTWVFDWQQVADVPVDDGPSGTSADYFRDPAMGLVNFQGRTYAASSDGRDQYLQDLQVANGSNSSAVMFVTTLNVKNFAFTNGQQIVISRIGNYGRWRVSGVDSIVSHEMSHVFGAHDEYDEKTGTPCSDCDPVGCCSEIPNGNCHRCAHPKHRCIMAANRTDLCAYTQGHIGWADLFVEVATANDLGSGTDDDVWLDIGARTFTLNTTNFNDRERGYVEGYALNYTGVERNEIKRVGIRKSRDGLFGPWHLHRVRLWHRGELVCDADNIDQWLSGSAADRWWFAQSCITDPSLVNRLRVKVTTADEAFAGTDDSVTIEMGGQSWDLDNFWRNDFERGHTDTFDLDPGTGLFRSMLGSVRIHKSFDGPFGGWKLAGLEVIVNGSSIFSDQHIDKWLGRNDRDWFGTIP